MTLAQAREHSVAQLKLLRAAARRIRASDVVISMQATYAAFAAVMVKNGHRTFEKMQSQFRQAASDDSN